MSEMMAWTWGGVEVFGGLPRVEGNISEVISQIGERTDYGAGYIPISVPTSILPSNNSSSSSISAMCDKDVVKMVYDDVGHHGTIPQELRLPDVKHGEEFSHTQCLDARFRLSNPPLHPGTPYSNIYMPHH
ncbi:hypothetical protein FOXG_16732 [Fusarium oxysporum f. sp. lycopersici 4287]|uniref:Uncharacterized protein n=2 Tax=Fusarium oxysporum TaxID=5507 RepID=A0A0J9W8A9_FUSO4|nr:hypothetical protein FOXG_16732 [Fusarium oxysporum f. sp. lycopersici 4287]KNB19459.1 hypothetical protein FOXG_16732 [Fusarium oxysporum f. sp. lycopersici 4287]